MAIRLGIIAGLLIVSARAQEEIRVFRGDRELESFLVNACLTHAAVDALGLEVREVDTLEQADFAMISVQLQDPAPQGQVIGHVADEQWILRLFQATPEAPTPIGIIGPTGLSWFLNASQPVDNTEDEIRQLEIVDPASPDPVSVRLQPTRFDSFLELRNANRRGEIGGWILRKHEDALLAGTRTQGATLHEKSFEEDVVWVSQAAPEACGETALLFLRGLIAADAQLRGDARFRRELRDLLDRQYGLSRRDASGLADLLLEGRFFVPSFEPPPTLPIPLDTTCHKRAMALIPPRRPGIEIETHP